MDTLDQFKQVSSLSINLNKTNAMWLGTQQQKVDAIGGIQPVTSLTILGVDISYSSDVLSLQLKKILAKIRGQLNMWGTRQLSLYGKIQIVKTFALSQVIYIASMVQIPETCFQEVIKVAYEFIWKGPDRIKRQVMVKSLEEGGLKMICLKSLIQAQKVKWINRVFSSNSKGWKAVLLDLLNGVGRELIFHCNVDVKCLKLDIPPWYKDVIKNWNLVTQRYC